LTATRRIAVRLVGTRRFVPRVADACGVQETTMFDACQPPKPPRRLLHDTKVL
jgi:hypothetical protein